MSEAGVGSFSALERRSCSGARKVQVPPPAGTREDVVVESEGEEGEEGWDWKEAEKSA